MSRALIPLLLIAGCSPGQDSKTADDTASDVVDLRRDLPDPPDGGIQWESPDLTIPAYSERQFCYFLTYDGDTVGMNYQGMFQSQYGHHVVINATTAMESDYPDGTLADCTDTNSLSMADFEPLFIGGEVELEDTTTHSYEFSLPDGMGVRLESGTRLVLQSHYINTSGDNILVHDAVNAGVVPEDEVGTWVGAVVNDNSNFSIPAGAAGTATATCTFDQDLSLLILLGHMHEWGTSYSVDWTHGDTTENIYSVPQWDPLYRDLPPLNEYDPGVMNVSAGDTFTSTCTWFNTTDQALEFPKEMCATAMMGYPTEVPIICDVDQ